MARTENVSSISLTGLRQVLSRNGGKNPADSNGSPEDSFTVTVPRLSFAQGQRISIIGSSGCGKTTLLTVLGLAQRPTGFAQDGEFSFTLGDGDVDLIHQWNRSGGKRRITRIRRRHLGFCLQKGELVPNLTVFENVELPLRLNDYRKRSTIRERVHEVLSMVGVSNGNGGGSSELVDRAGKLPSQLSGGQYQRVALARAIVHSPSILFVDEPTASLDPNTARGTLDALHAVSSEAIIVMITHDHQIASDYSDFIIRMHSVRKGEGEIQGFARKVEGNWIETGPDWTPRTS